ncbi:insulinase family protein [candidate division KSB1 bacterium]|nr:insulinase family protein [candidate division KSB1 bacterium]
MDIKYKKTLLSNGITLITEFMPHVRSVSIGAWLQIGSRDEDPVNNGVSHFLEHMAFKGTSNRNTAAIAESLESVGGNLNAFTGKEVTCYYANVLDQHVELAVDVIADLISNSLILEEDIEKEKNVILEEISSLEDTPDELVHEYFQKNLFNGHPLSYSILGSKKTIKLFNHDILVDFYKKRYVAKNLIISAAGNIDHKHLEKYLIRYFQIPEGDKMSRNNGHFNPVITEKTYPRNVAQAHICIGNKAIPYNNPQKYALLLLHALLGGGMSSRLFQIVREKYGVAYTVFTFADFYSDSGIFGVYLGVDKSNISRSIKLIKDEFERVKKEEISENELDRLKSQIKGNLMLGLESTFSRMNRLANMEMYLKRYFTLDMVLAGIDNVKTNDLIKLANDLLTEDLSTSIIVPK